MLGRYYAGPKSEPEMRLSDRGIAALVPPERGQKLYSDDTLRGFGIRVSQGGTKTFVLTIGAKRRRVTIGTYPVLSLAQARERAKTLLARRQLGLEKPPSPKFNAVHEEFLAKREQQLRATSYRKDLHRLRLFKELGGKHMAEITPEEVQSIIDNISAPSTRHEALIRFTLLIRFAIKRRYIESWPLDALEGKKERTSRDRVLSNEELERVLLTARMWRLAGSHFGTIIELLVLTGQRRHQIGSLERAHTDFDNSVITWPAEFMKAGRRHTIPISDRVRAILEPRRVNGLYFPNKHGGPFSFSGLYDRSFRVDCGFSDWTLHDLRRTFATRWQEIGVNMITIEKVLSHSTITGGLVGVYQRHAYMNEMRAAFAEWESHLAPLMKG